jgi:ABC-type glycerol-3-phosphate transport system substrate-binding protein
MKKLLLGLFVLFFTAAFVFAGGGQQASADGDIKLRIMTRWSDDAPMSVYWRNMVADWNNQKNGITLIDESLSDETAYFDKLRSSIATGNQPDIFIEYGGSRIQDYVDAGILLDIQPYLDADPTWRDSFLNDVFDKWHFANKAGTYGVPAQFYSVFLFYNKKMLADAGFTAPPTTIDEWRTMCEAMVAKGIQPMSLGERDIFRGGHLLNNFVMKNYGAQGVTNLANRSMNYDDPRMTGLYSVIKEFNDKGYFGQNAVGVTVETADAEFLTNKVAMYFQGSWYLPQVAASYEGDISNVGVAPFPYGNAAYKDSWQGGAADGYSISNRPATNEAAMKVVKYFTSPEFFAGMEAYCKGGLYVSKFDTKPGVVLDSPTVEGKALLVNAKEFRDDIQVYDPESHMLDTVRSAVQGLFIGNSPEQVGREIVGRQQIK